MIKKNKIHMFVFSFICILLSACANKPESKKSSSLDQMINDAFQTESMNSNMKEQAVIDHEIASALLPDINLSAPGVGSIDVEPRFDIKVHRAKIRQFFMGLVEDSNYNMVLHPKVKGRITLDLKNVTVADVMDIARDVYGYDYEITERGYTVFPNAMRTRIFTMNYLNVSRSGDSKMTVSSGQVTESISGSGDSASTSKSVSGSSINTTSHSNFWVSLKESLSALVGKKDGRNVVVSPQSGLVIVRALPDELRAVEKFINKTQNYIQRQVIIEAKIIEVELNERFQSGINWAKLASAGNNSALIGQIGGGSIFSGTGVTGISGNTGDLNPSALSQITGTAARAFGGMFSLALNAGSNFSAFIEVLKTQGDVQVLSSPQISTINNQKAVIKVGRDEFFITDIQTNTSTTTGSALTQSNVELTPFFSGVALDVIPQISENGDIILHIHPTVSSVIEQTKNIGISGGLSLSVPLAVSSIRESDSIIRARSGQVVIIGGLMQNSVEEQVSKIPLLGDIPILGALFRHTQEISKKSELVILLRAIVINNDKQMDEYVKTMKSRFKKIRYR